MQSINTQTLVHTGIELVVIGGLTFWFNRKLALCQNEINELQDKVTKYEELFNQQGTVIAHHDQILRQLLGENPRQLSGQKQSFNIQQSQSPISRPPPPDVSTEYLDEILKSELDNITDSRENPECTDDVCELKGSKLKKKNRIKKSVKQN